MELLDLRPHLFNGVEIGTVRWKEPDFCAGRLNGGYDGWRLVRGQVVQHDNISIAKIRDQHVPDIRFKDFSIRRSLNHHGGRRSIQSQGREHRRRTPMPTRRAVDNPPTPDDPSIQAGHVGPGPAFIEEDQMMRIHVGDAFPPRLTLDLHIGALLLAGVQRLFLRWQPSLSNAR